MCLYGTMDWYIMVSCFFFFFKQKTAYEMRISDWSSDVCSSDLPAAEARSLAEGGPSTIGLTSFHHFLRIRRGMGGCSSVNPSQDASRSSSGDRKSVV